MVMLVVVHRPAPPTHSPDHGEDHQGRGEVVGLVVHQVTDDPVVPLGQIAELGLREAIRPGEEVVPRSEGGELHLSGHVERRLVGQRRDANTNSGTRASASRLTRSAEQGRR